MWDTRHNYGYLRRQFTYVRVAVLTNVILRIHDLVRWLEILVTFLPRYGKPEGIKNQGMWMIDIPHTRSRQTMAPGNAVQCDTSYFTGVRLWVGYRPVLEQYMVRSITTYLEPRARSTLSMITVGAFGYWKVVGSAIHSNTVLFHSVPVYQYRRLRTERETTSS